jgi:hypothetical protein
MVENDIYGVIDTCAVSSAEKSAGEATGKLLDREYLGPVLSRPRQIDAGHSHRELCINDN